MQRVPSAWLHADVHACCEGAHLQLHVAGWVLIVRIQLDPVVTAQHDFAQRSADEEYVVL